MLLAQLTDTHVVDPTADQSDLLVDNNARLTMAVSRLNAETVQPDAVIATGDLTNDGTARQTELLVEMLGSLRAPLIAIPGNHDSRAEFRAAFDMPWATTDGHLSWTTDIGELRVIGLDTLKPGSHGGLFDDERRRWLTGALAEARDRPVVVAMHHPPFLSGVQWMDTMALEGMDDFVEVIRAAVDDGVVVRRILCGHLHRPLIADIAGVTATVAPSTVHHIELNLHPEAKVELIRDPGGYHLHHLTGSPIDGSWVSHLRYIDTGEQPVQPAWGNEVQES